MGQGGREWYRDGSIRVTGSGVRVTGSGIRVGLAGRVWYNVVGIRWWYKDDRECCKGDREWYNGRVG